MASPFNAVLCALVAAAFWTALGYAAARHVLPRVLALGAAPVFGWAVFSAATLPILTLDRVFGADGHRHRGALSSSSAAVRS